MKLSRRQKRILKRKLKRIAGDAAAVIVGAGMFVGLFIAWANEPMPDWSEYIEENHIGMVQVEGSDTWLTQEEYEQIGITGLCLEDGTEVTLDQPQANLLNGQGIITAINDSGWKSWGNNTACYPANTDPKDRWFCCRRFFSWWGNSFILTYKQKVDEPGNYRLIESIVDSENIRGKAERSRRRWTVLRNKGCEVTQQDLPLHRPWNISAVDA